MSVQPFELEKREEHENDADLEASVKRHIGYSSPVSTTGFRLASRVRPCWESGYLSNLEASLNNWTALAARDPVQIASLSASLLGGSSGFGCPIGVPFCV